MYVCYFKNVEHSTLHKSSTWGGRENSQSSNSNIVLKGSHWFRIGRVSDLTVVIRFNNSRYVRGNGVNVYYYSAGKGNVFMRKE